MHRRGARGQGENLRERGPRPIQERLGFATRHEPGIQICRTSRIDLLQGFERWIALIQLDRAVGLECGETARNGATSALGKNQAQSCNEIELLGPQMKQRLLTGAAHFPGHARAGSEVATVLAHFDDSGGGEFLKAGLQFRGKFHAPNYRRYMYLINYIFYEVLT